MRLGSSIQFCSKRKEHTLLKYSMIEAKQERMHSAMHSRMPLPSSFSRAARANMRRASRIATINDPKQIDPNEVVTVRTKALLTAWEQQWFASSGSNHQCPTVPATVTWTELYQRSKVEEGETGKSHDKGIHKEIS